MVDEYWIIIRCRRWSKIPLIQKTFYFNKVMEFDKIRDFFDQLKLDFPNSTVRLGVTRGNDIYLIR